MNKRGTNDRTAHISIIAGMINPTNVRFSKSEDTILPHSLIFSKGYIITDGGQLGSAYLDVVVPLETIITDCQYGERMAGNVIKVRIRAYWKPLYRFKPEIPLCRTQQYYTIDGIYAGIQYMLRAIKEPVHYTMLDNEDRSWGFNWKNTHILCEDQRPVSDPDNTLCLMANSFFEASHVANLTAEPIISTLGPDGYDLDLFDQADQAYREYRGLGVFEGIKKALQDR